MKIDYLFATETKIVANEKKKSVEREKEFIFVMTKGKYLPKEFIHFYYVSRLASSRAVLVQITPLLGALVGVVVTLVLIAICIVIFVRFKKKVSPCSLSSSKSNLPLKTHLSFARNTKSLRLKVNQANQTKAAVNHWAGTMEVIPVSVSAPSNPWNFRIA